MTPPVSPLAPEAVLDPSVAGYGTAADTTLGRVERLALRRSQALRFVRFAIVGGLASIVYLSLTQVFMVMGAHYMSAATAAFACAIVTNFAVNKSWTFRGRGERHVLAQLVGFAGVQVAMMVINLSALFVVVDKLDVSPVVLGQLLVAAVLLPVNFLASRRWGFR